jgi:hypothetical protein
MDDPINVLQPLLEVLVEKLGNGFSLNVNGRNASFMYALPQLRIRHLDIVTIVGPIDPEPLGFILLQGWIRDPGRSIGFGWGRRVS